MRYNFLRQFQVRQYAEYGKWTHEPFLKSAYCAHQNRSIARGSVGREICTWLTGALHDIFGQIYPSLSVLPHHFHIPCLHFCFLISMVRLYSNEWTGNLSVLLFVALLLSELNGEAWTYQGCPGGPRHGRCIVIIILVCLDCKTVGFFLKISKEIGKAWRKSLTRAKRACLTRP